MMSSSSVWVQLYYEGKNEREGNPIKIRPIPEDIADLAKEVKKELELDARLNLIFVYPPKSSGDQNKYKPGKKLEEVIEELKNTTPPTSDDHPLIVVAPDPPQQQPANEKIDYVYAYVQEKKQDEATLQLSKPLVSQYQRAVQNIGVRIDAPEWEKDSTLVGEFDTLSSGMAAFDWGPGKEDCLANRSLYLAYLRNNQNITLPPKSKLFDGAEYGELLSTNFVSFGVKTKGNIDVVVAHERHQEIHTTRHNMWAGVELKKQDNNKNDEIHCQVVLQHLSASFLNEDTGILTIMTDLGPRWHFYWFSKEKNGLMAYKAQSKGEANYLIRHMMGSSGSALAPTSVPTDFLNRASWNAIFPPREDDAFMEEAGEVNNSDKGGGQDSSGTSSSSRKGEASGGGAQQNRQSTPAGGNSDIAGSANVMANSLDFMDEEEEKEARFKDVLECILPQLGVFPHRELGHDHYAEGPSGQQSIEVGMYNIEQNVAKIAEHIGRSIGGS